MTDSAFIVEMPLTVSPAQERILLDRFEIGRRLYNVLLQDALTSLDLMRQSKAWQDARKLPKGKARSQAFQVCQRKYQFREYDLHALAAKHKHAAGWAKRISSLEAQKIASRAWNAAEEYAFGKRGRPRFKSDGRPLHSMEGITNQAGIRWKTETGCVEWNGLVLPARMPNKQQDPYILAGLQSKTKYCRIVWRKERGHILWFIQLVQSGHAPAKYEFLAKGEKVGLDIGPSTIAVSADGAAGLLKFAPSVDHPWAKIRRLQRAQDRSRRAMNPSNFDEKGRAKKGARVWKKSERYKARQTRLAEQERVLAAARKRDHGELANTILGLGNVVRTETLSYRSFQKNFGRSSKTRAPGMFIQLLNRKAESAGGKLVELNTRRLRMSQYDHVTGQCVKKPLSQRWHRLGGDTVLVQRDIYSAFLTRNVEAGEHNPTRLNEDWAAQEPVLRRAGLCVDESASGKAPAVPTVEIPSERIARQRRLGQGLRPDAVGTPSREPANPLVVRF